MAEVEENAANQIPEGGVQDEAANQIPEGGAPDESVKENVPGDAEPKTVSIDAVIAETKKRQAAEAQLETETQARQAAEQQANIMRQQAMTVQQAPVAPPEDGEYVQHGELRQLQAQQTQQMQYNTFVAQHPDAAEVVGQGIGTGSLQPSEHLQKALRANPLLYNIQITAAQGNAAALEVLYMQANAHKEMAAQQQELETLKQAQAATTEQQAAIAAKTGVTSPLAVGGGGAMTGTIPEPGTAEGDAYFESLKAGDYD